MSETILINLNSTNLIHVPGMFQYAKTAYKTGDHDIALNIMDGLVGQSITREGQLAILQELIPTHQKDLQIQFEILPCWFIAKEQTP